VKRRSSEQISICVLNECDLHGKHKVPVEAISLHFGGSDFGGSDFGGSDFGKSDSG
jgi:hypothetical protein